ncbi:hypothetical protein CDAR_616901 [Caerostris darwini]|uniref:Uncharacterized protein n=1 Tax=Caerostris darwini TaxID=1538125 RepID=A0AAV4S2D0_9ARAC|nr:hypothetical protein CDAR_616901 [Caerostris darwini]
METAVSNRKGSLAFQSQIDAITKRIFPVHMLTRMPNANESIKIDIEAHEPEISVRGMTSTFEIIRSALLLFSSFVASEKKQHAMRWGQLDTWKKFEVRQTTNRTRREIASKWWS